MMTADPARGFSLWPESASTGAPDIDRVYIALLGLTLFFALLIGALALGFGVKYRAGAQVIRDRIIHKTPLLEITWILGPFLIALAIFVWGAVVYMDATEPPAEARAIYVVGQQWMWKVQHPGGRREINELHVPSGEPIKLVMTSQDVIHSFFVPAFRNKRDVLPGQYTYLWFEATRPGTYHLFCAEYCGADHARMRGRVVVMTPADFQRWLAADPSAATSGESESASGEAMPPTIDSPAFVRFGCDDCHQASPTPAGPALHGLFGQRLPDPSHGSATVDESYLRQSILEPNAVIAAGYAAPSTMPSYANQIDEYQMIELIEFIKSLRDAPMREALP